MTTHVFIVDPITFKSHLEYLFVGTGAKDETVGFNNSSDSTNGTFTERMLVGMISDANRVRRGDLIIFYLQQNSSNEIYEGKFYGIFKARNDWSFLDNNDDQQYLKNQLRKSLTFRSLIEPYRVYSDGVTEWEALDEIRNISAPHQMLWSLIYRKLKGNRGNTMITIYESERLCQLIRDKNNRNKIEVENKRLTFNVTNQKIEKLNSDILNYSGRQIDINVLPRLISKYSIKQAFEPHLQAYIVKVIGKNLNPTLDSIIIGNNSNIEWLGNEVSCGVGMQRIDVMLSLNVEGQRTITPIELKAVEASEDNVIQIKRYIDWIEQYYNPNMQSDIQPILISKKIDRSSDEKYQRLFNKFREFNAYNLNRCHPIKFVEYTVSDNDIEFIQKVF